MTSNTKSKTAAEPEEKTKEELKTCFIVMPISNADGYDPGHFNRVYDYIIKPACEAAGFKPSRADDTKHTNTIILDILNQIVQADMVICDLSSKNPNVMYELGIRQAFNLPVVLIKDTLTQRVFDTSSLRDIEYDHSLRIDNVNSTVRKVTEALKSTYEMKDKDTHSLISLLNIQPANLPERKEISLETSLILEEIRALSDRNTRIFLNQKSNVTSPDPLTHSQDQAINLYNYIVESLSEERKLLVNVEGIGMGEILGFNEETKSLLVGYSDGQTSITRSLKFPYRRLLTIVKE
jgi:hypothetical protein